MTAEEGASLKEQLIEAVRRNNTDLLEQVLNEFGDDAAGKAELINGAKDALGNYVLHVGALYGSYEAVDILLDQDGVEVDPVNGIEGDTPLHSIVRYSKEEPEHGQFMMEMLIDAGCDPRIKNKRKQKPLDLVDKRENPEIVNILQGAEYAAMMGPEEETKDQNDDPNDAPSDSD